MKIFKNRHALQEEILNFKNISFVPTMGGLHKGHISLIKRAKKFSNKVVVSIFVNPKQFNNKKDFHNYPRNFKKDLDILRRLNVYLLYLPTYKDIFKFNTLHRIFLHNFSNKLCGKKRTGHFKGVINIVNRFLQVIKPKYLFLGNKDFQQLVLINKHIKKNKINTKIIACKIVREKNGVACSTRNNRLNKPQIKIASKVFSYLNKIKNSNKIKTTEIKKKLFNIGVDKIDYIELIDIKTLKKTKKKKNRRIFVAYYLNKVRLIDNI